MKSHAHSVLKDNRDVCYLLIKGFFFKILWFQAAHYIGEMCRYVLMTPPSPNDKQHKVRTVYGNGMRPTVSIQIFL